MNLSSKNIFLPGELELFNLLTKTVNKSFEKILVIGESSEQIAVKLARNYNCIVEYIVEDYDALLTAKLILGNENPVNVKLMDYETTDFEDDYFDLVFAQASVTRENRKKILREINRILKSESILAIGEIALTTSDPPKMITDMLNWAGIVPLQTSELEKYYKQKKFKILARNSSPDELPKYYKKTKKLYDKRKAELSEREKSFYKKLINRINHEANLFIKFGGKKYLTFVSIIARKIEE